MRKEFWDSKKYGNEMTSNSCMKPQLKLCPVLMFSLLLGAPYLTQLGSEEGIAGAVPIALGSFQWGEGAARKERCESSLWLSLVQSESQRETGFACGCGSRGSLTLQQKSWTAFTSKSPLKKGTKGICPTLGYWVSAPGHSSCRCYQCK